MGVKTCSDIRLVNGNPDGQDPQTSSPRPQPAPAKIPEFSAPVPSEPVASTPLIQSQIQAPSNTTPHQVQFSAQPNTGDVQAMFQVQAQSPSKAGNQAANPEGEQIE